MNLTSQELLTFAGLARWLIAADGVYSEAEARVLYEAADALMTQSATSDDSPYRQTTNTTKPTGEALQALLDEAAVAFADEKALQEAAKQVTRPEAREAIYSALFSIAGSDMISGEEWPLLDWLAEEWSLGPE